MNSKNRKALADAEKLFTFVVSASIEQLRNVLEDMHEKENKKMDNIPESLQDASTGQCVADAIEMLEDKLNSLEIISEEIESSFAMQ